MPGLLGRDTNHDLRLLFVTDRLAKLAEGCLPYVSPAPQPLGMEVVKGVTPGFPCRQHVIMMVTMLLVLLLAG